MTEAVLYGNPNVNQWLASKWSEHYQSYHKTGITIIKYEDLLAKPLKQCKTICNALAIPVDEKHLKESIAKQAFDNKKEQVVAQQHTYLNKLIRKGKSGYWKTAFKPKLLKLFKKELSGAQDYYRF